VNVGEQERDSRGRFAGGGGQGMESTGARGHDAESIAMSKDKHPPQELPPGYKANNGDDRSFDDPPKGAVKVKEAKPHASNVLSWVKAKFGK
jgi:hypothetical protein